MLCVPFDVVTSTKIGGIGSIVEIDESKFGKRKFHKGRRVDGVWVFGGIERNTKKCFFRCVADRTADTLVNIIKECVQPGTTIYSDCWKAYARLNEEGFHHLTVNHSLNFVDPESGVHTNTIESTWRALKTSLPRHGTTKHLYDSYFAQYCIRKQFLLCKEDPFLEFLNLVKIIYSPSFDPSEDEIKSYREKKRVKQEVAERVVLKEINDNHNNMNDSLDDFQL